MVERWVRLGLDDSCEKVGIMHRIPADQPLFFALGALID